MPLITYAATGSLTAAGTVGTAASLAMLAAVLPGGVVVDRADRKVLLMAGSLLRAGVYGAAALAWYAGHLTFPVLLVVGLASGTCSGVFGLASSAAVKHVVPAGRLPSAAAAD